MREASTAEPNMAFGQKIRELRQAKGLSQRALAKKVGTSFTYISKIETGKLDFGSYPGEEMIQKLATALDADEDDLLLLAEKIPEKIRTRVLQQPDAFRRIAELDDPALADVLRFLDGIEDGPADDGG